ncbi:HAD family hydrolase [Sporolactobacillus sp. Y61]|uniref:HAD family hydrolase n=1 Tax=Sporolactobacillus sp. Y61 TaxID=3160863 RepID=A0AAU8IIG5_9BACL
MFKFKEQLKQKLNYYPKFNQEKLIQRIKLYPIVSFDIFDTLIKRDVAHPSDLFRLVQRNYHRLYGDLLNADFQSERELAEFRARAASDREEITFDEIYNQLTDYTPIERDRLKKLEINLELEMCQANPAFQDVYNWCRASGKKIFIISDMYLPQDVIERILRKNGYRGYCSLYLSCTYGLQKSSGSIFKKLISEQDIRPDQIIHVGDSCQADIQGARRAGISSVHIAKYRDRLLYENKRMSDNFDYQTLYAYINNHVVVTQDPFNDYYQFGYESFGPLLYGFSKWLHNELKKNKLHRVFFLSRDGYILKRAYETLYPDDSVISKYLYVSRRSLRVPFLRYAENYDSLIQELVLPRQFSISEFITALGLNLADSKRKLNTYNVDFDELHRRNAILSDRKIKWIYHHLQKEINENSLKEEANLTGYLRQNQVNGKFAIVDIGWVGSIQRYLRDILLKNHIDNQIKGYYIALTRDSRPYKEKYHLDFSGYVYDCANGRDARTPIGSFIGLIESLFLAQEGSTKTYMKNKNHSFEPVLFPYEYLNDGHYTKEALAVKAIQEGAIQFIKDYQASSLSPLLHVDQTIAFNNIYHMGIHPKKNEMKLFSFFRFFDNDQKTSLINNQSLYRYILRPQNFLLDFSHSKWKSAFLKNTVHIPVIHKFFRNG